MTSPSAPRGFRQMLAEASAVIETIDVQHALRLVGDAHVQFVDVREANEVAQTGMLPGAVHAPRGFLEFLADPESPMHRKELAGRKLVLYCASGGRSTLAAKTLRDMGLDVCHIAGGIAAWTAAGGAIAK